MLVLKFFNVTGNCIFLFHSVKNHFARKFIPVGCDNCRCGIFFSDKFNRRGKFVLVQPRGSAENYAVCVFYLVVVEFSEIFHIHFAFCCIGNSCKTVERNIFRSDAFNRFYNVAQFSDARRLYKNTLGSIFFDNFFKSFAEVSDKTATDTARIHLGDFNTCILKKAAVDTDFTKLVFNKNKFFAAVCFFYKFFDKRCFSCSEKAGENINFCHFITSFKFCILRNVRL